MFFRLDDVYHHSWKNMIQTRTGTKETKQNGIFIYQGDETLEINQCSSKTYYKILIKRKVRTPTGISRWGEIYYLSLVDWSTIFRLPFYLTRETCIQTLQYKIIHCIICTSGWLILELKNLPCAPFVISGHIFLIVCWYAYRMPFWKYTTFGIFNCSWNANKHLAH